MRCFFYCRAIIAVLDVLKADCECRVVPADDVVVFAMEYACWKMQKEMRPHFRWRFTKEEVSELFDQESNIQWVDSLDC